MLEARNTLPNAKAMQTPANVLDWARRIHYERSNEAPHAMNRSLTILVTSFLASFAAEAQSTNDEIHLRAMVQDVVALTSFSGTVTPVDVDPKFALKVRIVSVDPAITNFTAGSVVTFAIHSPSKLFGGEVIQGKTHDISLRRKLEAGKVRFFDLELRKKQTNTRSLQRVR